MQVRNKSEENRKGGEVSPAKECTLKSKEAALFGELLKATVLARILLDKIHPMTGRQKDYRGHSTQKQSAEEATVFWMNSITYFNYDQENGAELAH